MNSSCPALQLRSIQLVNGICESAFSQCSKKKSVRLSVVSDSATPWTVACQAPVFMGFLRQEYWSGLSYPSPRDLPDPGIEPASPALQADSLPSEPPGKPFNKVEAHKHDRLIVLLGLYNVSVMRYYVY